MNNDPYSSNPNDPIVGEGFSQNPYATQPYLAVPPPPKKKWYKRNGGIILLLILCLPVGLILMWMYAPWNRRVKLIVSNIFASCILIAGAVNASITHPSRTAFTNQTSPSPTQSSNMGATAIATIAPTAAATSAPTPTSAPVPTPMPTVQPTQPPPTPVVVCNGTVIEGACYNTDPNGGSVVLTTPAGFCSHYTCSANFSNGTGYIVQCGDQQWSHSGGKRRVCSRNGGVIATLYKH